MTKFKIILVKNDIFCLGHETGQQEKNETFLTIDQHFKTNSMLLNPNMFVVLTLTIIFFSLSKIWPFFPIFHVFSWDSGKIILNTMFIKIEYCFLK